MGREWSDALGSSGVLRQDARRHAFVLVERCDETEVLSLRTVSGCNDDGFARGCLALVFVERSGGTPVRLSTSEDSRRMKGRKREVL